MLIGGVVGNEVEQQPQPSSMCFIDQRINGFQASEVWMDIGVVTHVVPEVQHGRCEYRAQPDRIGPKRLNMIKLLNNAVNVSHAVSSRISVTARVDLIYDRLLPPAEARRRTHVPKLLCIDLVGG